MKLREEGSVSREAGRGGGVVASLFAMDAGWGTGFVLLVVAAWAEGVGFNSTYCLWRAKYRPSVGIVHFEMARNL